MFNFFKKKKEVGQPEETNEEERFDQYGATITFFIEDGEPKADIAILDYEDDSVEGLALILAGLVGCTFFTATMDMGKDALMTDDRPEELLKIVTILEALELFQQQSRENAKEEPCIKPQDALGQQM